MCLLWTYSTSVASNGFHSRNEGELRANEVPGMQEVLSCEVCHKKRVDYSP